MYYNFIYDVEYIHTLKSDSLGVKIARQSTTTSTMEKSR
jgi:hypothetical protein